ncbi:hypothetical protein KKB10_01005 [Patescibacteria group bacterium]|nr:hypothetical protein [Patescibacteria group bacterium]MBU1075627.1 hypothetical protein [Patescibacteria group bacterium]MBU1952223.1 hypothetical protein [Patescibacteria group bacterium]
MTRSVIITKSIGAGLVGIAFLASIYFILLTWVSGDWHHPFQQFLQVKYWMGTLFFGFGLQIGLFWYVRSVNKTKQINKITTANTGVSTATMIACCAHHLTEFIPILGLSAASIFLAKYQSYILAIAVIFNFLGIVYMINIIKKHKLYRLTI